MTKFTLLADWIREHLYEAHRGSFIEKGKLIMFGNDGVGDANVIRELEIIFEWVREHRYKVLGFSSCSKGHSWVIVLEIKEKKVATRKVDDMLWNSWGKAKGADNDPIYKFYHAAQYQTVIETMMDRPSLPNSLLGKAV